MKKLALLPTLFLLVVSCDESGSSPASVETPSSIGWSAEVVSTESTGDADLSIRAPGEAGFVEFSGGAPIPTGSTIRTASNTRAHLMLAGAHITMNHSTSVELVADAERTVALQSGQIVLERDHHEKPLATIALPTGTVRLHGTKVSAVAGREFSTVSVASGVVEVSDGKRALQAGPGDEIVLPREGSPTVHSAPSLGEEFGWSELTMADGEPIEVPRGLGKLVGKAPGGERERNLDMVKHSVSTKIQGNIAYTEIEERFRNPTGEVLEGVYRFPLPANAQISRLALDVNGTLMEGEFVETKRAEWIWNDIITASRDPAMLKWKQGNQFELRIFPIQPRDVRRVIIGYTQRLEPSAGGYRYVYPMPVDHARTIPAEHFEFEATVAGHDPTQIFQTSGYDATVEHEGNERDEAVTTVRWSQDDFAASGDFSMRYSTPFHENGLVAHRYDSNREERGFFAISIRP